MRGGPELLHRPEEVIPGRAFARTRNPGGRAKGSWIPGSREGARPGMTATWGRPGTAQIGTAIASNAESQLMRSTRFCTMEKPSPFRRNV